MARLGGHSVLLARRATQLPSITWRRHGESLSVIDADRVERIEDRHALDGFCDRLLSQNVADVV